MCPLIDAANTKVYCAPGRSTPGRNTRLGRASPVEVTLGEARLKSYIKTIGLFNTKAKNVIKLSELLLRDHHGEVPNDQKALEILPGVG